MLAPILKHRSTLERIPTQLIHRGGASSVTAANKSLAAKLNSYMTTTGKSLRDISEEMQISVL